MEYQKWHNFNEFEFENSGICFCEHQFPFTLETLKKVSCMQWSYKSLTEKYKLNSFFLQNFNDSVGITFKKVLLFASAAKDK